MTGKYDEAELLQVAIYTDLVEKLHHVISKPDFWRASRWAEKKNSDRLLWDASTDSLEGTREKCFFQKEKPSNLGRNSSIQYQKLSVQFY